MIGVLVDGSLVVMAEQEKKYRLERLGYVHSNCACLLINIASFSGKQLTSSKGQLIKAILNGMNHESCVLLCVYNLYNYFTLEKW